MGLNRIYESWSKDSRVLFVRWVIILFASGVGTLAIGWYKDYIRQKKYDALNEKMEILISEQSDWKVERLVMQNQIDELMQNQIKFNNMEEQYATPRVIKSLSGDVFSINNAYYNDFMKPFGFEKKDYRNDEQFWGEKVADIFEEIEQTALRQKRALTIPANFENPFNPGTYIDRKWTVNPLKDRYGIYIAIEISVSKEYN